MHDGFELTSQKERDLITLAHLDSAAMLQLVERACEHRRATSGSADGVKLSGFIGQIFLEPSTRTRISFSIAAKRLGLDVFDIDGETSSLAKGEALIDGARTLVAQGISALVIRQGLEGITSRIASAVEVPVINAGEGATSHPTQGLLDLMTLIDEWGDVGGKRIGIVGDIRHSRVARSDAEAFGACGAEVVLIAPQGYSPTPGTFAGVEFSDDFDGLLPTLDAVVMLRVQRERQEKGEAPAVDDYVAGYQLNAQRLSSARSDLKVLHPGPMNRGVEITDEVADGASSRVLHQVANGVHLRMAVLEQALMDRP